MLPLTANINIWRKHGVYTSISKSSSHRTLPNYKNVAESPSVSSLTTISQYGTTILNHFYK